MEGRSQSAAVLGACASEVAGTDAPDLAAWLFRRAVELSPRDGGLRLGRVACLLDAGKPGDALEGLDDAARKPLSYVEAFTYDSRNNLKTYVDAQLPSFSP